MRKVLAEAGVLYLKIAVCVLAAVGLFSLVGTRLGWFTPNMPSAKQLLSIDQPEQFAGSQLILSQPIPVDSERTYRLRVTARALPKLDGTEQVSRLYLGVKTFDANGKELKSGPGRFRYAGANNLKLNSRDGWKLITGTITGEGDAGHFQFRPGTKSIQVVLQLNYKGDETVVSEVSDLRFGEVIPLQP